MSKLFLIGIDAGPSEMMKLYKDYTMFDEVELISMSPQAKAIFGTDILSIEEIKEKITDEDLVLVGGQREILLDQAATIDCFKAFLMEFPGKLEEEYDERFDVCISCDLTESKDRWKYIKNPFFMERIEKLKIIEQPNNGYLFFALQAADDPKYLVESKLTLINLLNKSNHLFEKIFVKTHPNIEEDMIPFIDKLKRKYSKDVELIDRPMSLEDMIEGYEYFASQFSSLTLNAMLAGKVVFHCIDQETLETKGIEDIKMCNKKYDFNTTKEGEFNLLDQYMLEGYFIKHNIPINEYNEDNKGVYENENIPVWA